MILLPDSRKEPQGISAWLAHVFQMISDAYTHELGPALIPVTRNSIDYKYYNAPHTPISLPYQSLVNISYKRLLRGQLLPLLAAGKLGTQAYSFPAEQNGAGGPHPGEHYRNIMFLSHRELQTSTGFVGALVVPQAKVYPASYR